MSVVTRTFDKKDAPFSLGRNVKHDSRSRDYAFAVLPTRRVTTIWPHSTPVLDQGQISSCTGNAVVQLLNTDRFAPVRAAKNTLPKAKSGWLTESAALTVYSLGTHLDGQGADQYYPPNDDGCDGLSVTRAAVSLGFFDRYLHCFTWSQVEAAIQTQPCIAGVTWTQQMFTVNSNGFVSPGDLSDPNNVAGGHEVMMQGIDFERQCLVFLNSWGPAWGGGPGLTGGQFRISFPDFQTLLNDQGDVVVPHGVGLP